MNNRRDFLKAGVGIALASQISCSKTRSTQNVKSTVGSSTLVGDHTTDVVVVGGGFAGVTAARHLYDAGKRVILFEANQRLGGRTHTVKTYGNAVVDAGGTWIGPPQRTVMDLVKKYNVSIFPTYGSGRGVLDDGQKISHYDGTVPDIGIEALTDFGTTQAKLEGMAATINLQEPWKTPGALEFDQITFNDWLDRNMTTDKAKRMMKIVIEYVYAAHPRRFSLLHALYFIRCVGSLDNVFNIEGGAQNFRITGGTVSLINKMIEPIVQRVSLASPVREIIQDEVGVIVKTDSAVVRANRVIVAVPPSMASRILYSPSLSVDRDHLTQAFPMGSIIKFFAHYEENFWRKNGLNGVIVSLDGPIAGTFDNSMPGDQRGIIVGFLAGDHADRLRRLPADERKNVVVDYLGRLFGPQGARPAHYEEHDWCTEPWIRGCFMANPAPGIWTSYGAALLKPEGRIHWAGTETSREWYGYINGAVESGFRSANEVIPLV